VNFDWTTFALEVVNFLVLVWLLKHFLYRPVLAVIEQRRLDGEKANAAAQALDAQARSMKAQYEASLLHASEDRDRALAQLESEVALERSRRLATLDADMEAERLRRQALEARERGALDAAREREALDLAARFATHIFERMASPTLEASFIDLCLDELQHIKPDQRAALQTALAEPELPVAVHTAYPVSAEQRTALTAALGTLTNRKLTPDFAEDPRIQAGVRIRIGDWLLKLNLQDELEFFSSDVHHGK